jgi:hypothetical protein
VLKVMFGDFNAGITDDLNVSVKNMIPLCVSLNLKSYTALILYRI